VRCRSTVCTVRFYRAVTAVLHIETRKLVYLLSSELHSTQITETKGNPRE
jgi:hypothetical protein